MPNTREYTPRFKSRQDQHASKALTPDNTFTTIPALIPTHFDVFSIGLVGFTIAF